MIKARLGKEIVVTLQNDVGILDRIARIISDKGISILATTCWVDGPTAILRLITEDNLRVGDALRGQGFETRESDVVVADVAHKPGMMHGLTSRLAQGGIDIHHLYVTATAVQDRCVVVFASANNDRAVVLLNG